MVQQQVHEGHLTAVSQHSVQQAGGQAAGQSFVADRPGVVKVRLSASAEQQAETFQVVVRRADVEGTHHQGVQGAGAQEEPGTQLVVHVNVSVEPGTKQTVQPGFHERKLDHLVGTTDHLLLT